MTRVQAAFIFCLIGSLAATVLFWAMSSSSNVPMLFSGEKTEGSNHSIWNSHFWAFPMSKTDNKSITTLHSEDEIGQIRNLKSDARRSSCPDILSGMTKGKWVKRPLTPEEQSTVDTYLQESRGVYRIPSTYQRDDGLCGDVAYKGSPQYKHMWFKAICNPKGATPCCQTNKCVALTEVECQCPTCYDERQATHAEYAQWKPEDDRFEVKNFTKDEVCKILNGTTLHFVGDSFIRHLFAAMVIVMTNGHDGALKTNINPSQRHRCRGWHQITGLTCRDHLDEDRSLCDGTVKVKYTQVFPSGEFTITPPLLRSLRHVNKSIIVLGLGIHDNFNVTSVSNGFLLPFLNLHQLLSSNLTFDLKLDEVQMRFDDVHTSSSTANTNGGKASGQEDENKVNTTTSVYYANMSSQRSNSELNQTSTFMSSVKRSLNFKNILNNFLGFFGQENRDANSSEIEQLNNIDARNGLTPMNISDDNLRLLVLTQTPNKNQTADNSSFITHIPENSTEINVNVTNSTIIFSSFPKSDLTKPLWPRLLWIGTHAPGLLKSMKFKEQTADGVQRFNKGMRDVLGRWKVPYLETFSFTTGMVSFDGTHYGWGINMLKVHMLLTFIQNDCLENF